MKFDMDVKLRNVWAQVLDVDDADLDGDTNFFEAGGDSVAALRLVAAAGAVDLSVNIEDVFNHPTLRELTEKCQESSQVSKPNDTASEVSILDQDTMDTCAIACQVDRDIIEDIFPASTIQGLMFAAGKAYGTYVLQWVYQICGDLDRNLLVEAWDRLQRKHQILRTRLVTIGKDDFQVVLRSDMNWEEGNDLAEYKRQSLSQPIESSRPLFRYAVITEGDSSYFVWTAHHAGFDGWTRRMIFEHLQDSLSQPLEYAQRQNGAMFKDLISWTQHQQETVSSGYWESVLEGFNGNGCVFSSSIQRLPATNSTLSRRWLRKSVSHSKFTMAAIVHAAWAISLGNVSGLQDILFSTTRSGRHVPIPGVESIFGPMLLVNAVRTRLEKEQSLEDYLQVMQTQLVSMIPHEHAGYEIIQKLLGSPLAHQMYLSWHPHGDDVLSKEMHFKNREGLPISLKPRRDFSTPFKAHFGIVLDVYEQQSSLDLYTSWDDGLRSQSDIEQLMADFVHNLDQLVGSSNRTVGDLWPGQGPRWVY